VEFQQVSHVSTGTGRASLRVHRRRRHLLEAQRAGWAAGPLADAAQASVGTVRPWCGEHVRVRPYVGEPTSSARRLTRPQGLPPNVGLVYRHAEDATNRMCLHDAQLLASFPPLLQQVSWTKTDGQQAVARRPSAVLGAAKAAYKGEVPREIRWIRSVVNLEISTLRHDLTRCWWNTSNSSSVLLESSAVASSCRILSLIHSDVKIAVASSK
jgi:hypothetical protein